MVQAGLCSTCVPPGAGKERGGGTPAIPFPVSEIVVCSTWATKKQHTPASARHSPVVALCGLFPGGAGTYPVRAAEATSERVAGTEERPVPVILNEVKNPSSPLRANRDGTGSTDPSTPLARLAPGPQWGPADRAGELCSEAQAMPFGGLRSAQDDSEEKRDRISPGQKPQNAAQRSGCVLERRSHGAQSKKRRLPQAPGVSEPCGVCFDDAGASRAAGCPPPAARHRAEARTHFS